MRSGLGSWRFEGIGGAMRGVCCVACVAVFSSCATMSNTGATTSATPPAAISSPQAALAALKEGNGRFVSGKPLERDLLGEVSETAGGQKPFAIVLGCIDSRVPPEVVFDQGIGDIFSARVAGNLVNEDFLGSMEFATAVAGAKLIVVLGHSGCGAIMGATDRVELGNLTSMLHKLEPAVAGVEAQYGERASSNAAFLARATELNVLHSMEAIKAQSPVITDLLAKGDLEIVGAMYDVATGEVTFHPQTTTKE